MELRTTGAAAVEFKTEALAVKVLKAELWWGGQEENNKLVITDGIYQGKIFFKYIPTLINSIG